MKFAMLLLLFASAATVAAQPAPLRIIAFGAHPDDCDIRSSGTASLWAKTGFAVKFVSVTNGDAGHQTVRDAELAKRRLSGVGFPVWAVAASISVVNRGVALFALTVDVAYVRCQARAVCSAGY